jgi:hypothetical protein
MYPLILKVESEGIFTMADKPLKPKEMPLDGRLVTAVDPVMIGPNFQELKNLRYFDTNPRAIKGMSKVNNTALSSHPKISTGYHFKKEQPAESHVLVQAFNSAETESKVFENTTAIPDVGDFSGTALHTDSGTGQGRFSEAPNGNVAYCNGAEALVWGGDEHFSSGFVNYDPDGDWSKDYTTKVQNTLSDSDNIATLTKVTGDLPSSTGLLLHLDNNVTDSSTSAHTVTNSNVTFTTDSKFGTHAADTGATGYLTVPDHADFDFSGENFTIDFWMKSQGWNFTGTIYSQATDANNFFRFFYSFGALKYEIMDTGVSTIRGLGQSFVRNDLANGEFHHIELTEDGDDWYIFVDGSLVYYANHSDKLANYTGEVYIGAMYDGSTLTDQLTVEMDEFRVGKASLHTDFFEARQVPYGTAAAYVDIGAVRPLAGAKFYVGVANTATSSANVLYWKRTSPGITDTEVSVQGQWVNATNIIDGTVIGGDSLAQTGSIAFDDTALLASPRIFNNTHLYWHRFVFTDIDDTTTISQVTLDMSLQGIRDLWDGEVRSPVYFEVDTGAAKYDNTINVFEGTYTSTNSATYSDLSALPANGSLLVGFTERMTALDIRFVTGKTNTNVGPPALIQAWNGSNYDTVSLTQDGTYSATAPFGKSGVMAWSPLTYGNESTQEIGGRPPLFYYLISFIPALTAGSDTVHLYHIGGITAQRPINGYKFPILSHNRLMLGSNQDDKKNSLLIGAPDSTSTFNGVDYREISFGNDDELVAGSEVFGQFGSDIYNLTLVCKKSESWLLSEQQSSFEWFRVSPTIGCTAPLTMTSIHTAAIKGIEGVEGTEALNGVIFQSTDAIYLFDGREFQPIHRDIEDVFTRINKTYLDKSVGFLDETNQEWHWLITTGASTTLNEEWVFDLKRDRWYQIDRGLYLQSGFSVEDTVGNFYNYGTIDTGYIERLENGTTFDGSDMNFSLRIGDNPLSGSTIYESRIRQLNLLMKSKNTTTNSVVVTHYGDGETAGTALTSISPANSNGRISSRTKSENTGKHVFHSIKLAMTTNDEDIGFEPLGLGVFYQDVGEHKGIKNN